MKWYSREIWGNREGWKYIAINMVGNLFPVWFLVIIDFANNGISLCGFVNTISQPYTYLILSATFASSTLYLWIKKLKSEGTEINSNNKNFSIGMILYIVILFPVIGFYLSKKDCLERIEASCSPIIPVIYFIMLPIVIFVYIYYQLYDFYEIKKVMDKSTSNPTKKVDGEIKDLNDQL